MISVKAYHFKVVVQAVKTVNHVIYIYFDQFFWGFMMNSAGVSLSGCVMYEYG